MFEYQLCWSATSTRGPGNPKADKSAQGIFLGTETVTEKDNCRLATGMHAFYNLGNSFQH